MGKSTAYNSLIYVLSRNMKTYQFLPEKLSVFDGEIFNIYWEEI